MPLPLAKRESDMSSVLLIMFETTGDDFIYNHDFLTDDPGFSTIPETTWLDMHDRGWIIREPLIGGRVRARLEPLGWMQAVVQFGMGTEFKERLGCLSGYLKKLVDGRQAGGDVPLEHVSKATGIPAGWIYNMCKCRYWQEARGQHGAEIDPRTRPFMIVIESRFGMKIV